jgi:hypothetical protein
MRAVWFLTNVENSSGSPIVDDLLTGDVVTAVCRPIRRDVTQARTARAPMKSRYAQRCPAIVRVDNV